MTQKNPKRKLHVRENMGTFTRNAQHNAETLCATKPQHCCQLNTLFLFLLLLSIYALLGKKGRLYTKEEAWKLPLSVRVSPKFQSIIFNLVFSFSRWILDAKLRWAVSGRVMWYPLSMVGLLKPWAMLMLTLCSDQLAPYCDLDWTSKKFISTNSKPNLTGYNFASWWRILTLCSANFIVSNLL